MSVFNSLLISRDIMQPEAPCTSSSNHIDAIIILLYINNNNVLLYYYYIFYLLLVHYIITSSLFIIIIIITNILLKNTQTLYSDRCLKQAHYLSDSIFPRDFSSLILSFIQTIFVRPPSTQFPSRDKYFPWRRSSILVSCL